MPIFKGLHEFLLFCSRVERRFDVVFRSWFERLLRGPLERVVQYLINAQRPKERLALAEERKITDEDRLIAEIIETMRAYMKATYQPGSFQRAGNTKLHGLVRGTVEVHGDLPNHLRRGVLAHPKTYPAWVRLAGPGPDSPKDIDDVGVLSMTIKMMGVPGPKMLDDETSTQDLLGITTPSFTTPDCRANAKLQAWILRKTPLWYFVDPRDPHFLDLGMQAIWSKTQSNPLGETYFSCVPYLLGEGQAMQYSFHPTTPVHRKIPRLPLRPPDNYLRENMVRTLAEHDVAFAIRVQVQTDPFRMPIEDASVVWPERLSPRVTVATLRIPKQRFDSAAQLAFQDRLSYNPWHCLPEHRPLGNQNRARLSLYRELSRFRQQMNRKPHVEPTGAETFDD